MKLLIKALLIFFIAPLFSQSLILTHKSLSRGERGKKFSCLSMTPIAGSPTGVIERQENLKPQPPIESGLVCKDQAQSPIDAFSRTDSHPQNERWQGHALKSEEAQCIEHALSQSYRYMNAGSHSTAFVSQDGKYILKFFKKKRFEVPEESFFIPFYTHWRRERKLKKREAVRDRVFSAYRICCDRLAKETGVLFVHFNWNAHLNQSVQLTDASGKSFSLLLDDWDFVLERRAVSLQAHLDALLKQGNIEGAALSIRRLLDLQRIFFYKGMRNRDIEFVNNYGFIDGSPVLFDVDRLLPCIGPDSREKYQKKLKAFLPAFQNWIHAYYPMLSSDCDAEIAKISRALQEDPEEFSMNSFHPFEPRWECCALDDAAQTVLNLALSQPYRYLNSGGQCFVFVSQDMRYVIKVFKQAIFSVPENKGLPLISRWIKQRKLKQRALKRDRIFSAYQIACDRLAKETGVIYVHFNTTSHLERNLTLTPPSGKSCNVDLDTCDFVVERRAEMLQEHLDTLLTQGYVKEAGESIRRLLELYSRMYLKGVRDRDVKITANYGFVDGAPVWFDVGRLSPCVENEDKMRYQKKLKTLLPAFRNWVKLQYPMLLLHCDAAIADVLKTVYTP